MKCDLSQHHNDTFVDEILTEHKLDEQSIYELAVEYPLDHAANYLRLNAHPEDVFDESQLADWADANGYVKAV